MREYHYERAKRNIHGVVASDYRKTSGSEHITGRLHVPLTSVLHLDSAKQSRRSVALSGTMVNASDVKRTIYTSVKETTDSLRSPAR